MKFLSGYKTYLAAGANVLTSAAALAGVLSPTHGLAISTMLIGLAQIAQRMATSETLDQTVSDIKKLLHK